MAGGIFWLLGLIRNHRGAVEYDFRQRFGLGVCDIGARLSVSEAARLAIILYCDPSSMTNAAVRMRPDEPDSADVHRGDPGGRTPEQIRATLRDMRESGLDEAKTKMLGSSESQPG